MDGLEDRRRQAVEYLAECYARDLIDLRGYEDRRDRVVSADTADQITAATAGIGSRPNMSSSSTAPPVEDAPSVVGAPSVVCIMGDRKLVPDRIDGGTVTTTCVMGDVVVDLRNTTLTGPVRIHTVTIMGDTVVYVPESLHVHNEITAIMADVKEKGGPGRRKRIARETAPEEGPSSRRSSDNDTDSGPALYLTGLALMADVKIRRG